MSLKLRNAVAGTDESPRFLLFSGKGGVGKTTISSATAVWLARKGRRVLHVSTDLQKSLNDIYQQEIGETPTPIRDVPGLSAVNIETAESTERHRGKIMKTFAILDPDSPILKQMKDDRLTDCGCAQAAVFEMVEYLGNRDYDVVVFDTAPAGSTLEKIESQSRAVLALVNQVEMKKKLLAMFGDEQVEAQIAALEELKEKDQVAFEIMRSRECLFAMVMLPETLPYNELVRGIEDLESRFQIPVKGIVVNNVLPEAERDVNDVWRNHRQMQQRHLRLVYDKYPDRAIGQLQLLDTESVGVAQLDRLGQSLYGGPTS